MVRSGGSRLSIQKGHCLQGIKKEGEFTVPGFGKLVKQKRKAGINPKTLAKIEIPAKTVGKFRVAMRITFRH